MIGRRKAPSGSVAFGLGVLSLGFLAAGAARAEEGVFMRDTLSTLGLIEPDRPAITYNERAPLVMPPDLAKSRPAKPNPKKGAAKAGESGADAYMTLPPPRTRQADPQWPKDPEITQRERAAAEARKPIVRGAQGRMSDNNETLSPYEMQAGRRAGAEIPDGPVIRPGDNTRESTWVNPLDLLTGKKDDAEPSVIEPARDGLTDPPTGYRKAPLKVAKPQGAPVRDAISDNAEADPRAYLRQQNAR